jgi:hypothetical protein
LVVALFLRECSWKHDGRWAFGSSARIATYSGVFALDLDQPLPDAGRMFNGVSQRGLKLSGEVEAFIRGDEVVGARSS